MSLTKVSYSMINGAPINILDFGAVGDGTIDDTIAIKNAIAAATPSISTPYVATDATTVYAPNGNYLISEVITIPEHVNLIGDGKAITVFTCDDASSGIAFGTRTTDCRGSHSGGFTVDGNGIAANPLYIGLCVERSFFDIVAANGTSVGILVEAAQNNLFTNLNASYNPINLQLDYGAGNNTFIRLESDRGADTNLYITQTGTSPEGAFLVPTYNTFNNCIFERSSNATFTDACVFQDAGKLTQFISCAFSNATDTAPNGITIKLRNTYSLGSSIVLSGPFLSGISTTTAFDIEDASIRLYGYTVFENYLTAFKLGDTSSAEVQYATYGGVTNVFQNQSGGVKGQDELLRFFVTNLTSIFNRKNSTDSAFYVGVQGETYSRLKMSANGAIDLSDGINPPDVALFRASTGGVPGLGMTGPVRISASAAIMSGTGVPTIGLPNGSIFMRTDGSGTNDNVYVRRGSAWVGIA